MLQPLEWCKVIYALINPEANPQQMIYSLGDVYPQLGGSSWWEMVKVNFVTGQLASLNWAWCYVFQTASLFMLGMLIGRKGLFRMTDETHDRVMGFWQRVGIYALPSAVILYYLKDFIYSQIKNPFLKASMETIWNSWYNLAFMLVMVSAFLILYWVNKGKVQQILVPYGKMSLTDYITQSIIGSFIYYGYGGDAPLLRHHAEPLDWHRLLPASTGIRALVVPTLQTRSAGNRLASPHVDRQETSINASVCLEKRSLLHQPMKQASLPYEACFISP